jgi:cellulose synthase/poly-beta-1,6-N-acetylglucosamine synthase-like glycosyltransferase
MTDLALVLFWGSVALLAYTYVVFPAILFVRGLLWRKPYRTEDITPSVSMIIAAYNEAASIGEKLDNVVSLDYPRDCLEVIVASDGSTDETEAIVAQYEDRGVKLLALPRQGKAGALNSAVAVAKGEILVFSDANSQYAPDAIRQLVRPFADPEVGGVAGNQVYLSEKRMADDTAQTGDGERTYWGFDRFLKRIQSEAGNTISATGAIYAIRRSLFPGVPEGVTDDFATSTAVIAQGYRLVFAPDAKAFEPVAKSSGVEFGRKVRVMTRGLRAVLVRRELLNPFRFGFYALQLFSHKVLRRLMFAPLALLLVSNPFLLGEGLFYQLTMLAQIGFYGAALAGALFRDTPLGRNKLVTLPYYVCLVYLAAAVATFNVLRGHQINRWEPQRQHA